MNESTPSRTMPAQAAKNPRRWLDVNRAGAAGNSAGTVTARALSSQLFKPIQDDVVVGRCRRLRAEANHEVLAVGHDVVVCSPRVELEVLEFRHREEYAIPSDRIALTVQIDHDELVASHEEQLPAGSSPHRTTTAVRGDSFSARPPSRSA